MPSEFQIPEEPREWLQWPVTLKVRWLQNNARPRPTYAEAWQILRLRAMASVRARAARRRLADQIADLNS